MPANVIVRKVSFFRFMYETRKLDSTTREEVLSFIHNNKGLIKEYQFGRIPDHRVYSVLLKDGESINWKVTKHFL